MIQRTGSSKVLHRVVEANNTLYLSGITADNLDVGMEGQTQQICKKLEDVLASVDSDKTKLLSAQIFITDMAAKEEMNKIWTEWLSPEDLPARATIGVASLGKPKTLIEIVVTAAR